MSKKIHISQSIEGALANWNRAMWQTVARDNNLSVDEVKQFFRDERDKGHKLIPLSSECEGFDPVKGCPGHEVIDE